jgi:hypothetical protein
MQSAYVIPQELVFMKVTQITKKTAPLSNRFIFRSTWPSFDRQSIGLFENQQLSYIIHVEGLISSSSQQIKSSYLSPVILLLCAKSNCSFENRKWSWSWFGWSSSSVPSCLVWPYLSQPLSLVTVTFLTRIAWFWIKWSLKWAWVRAKTRILDRAKLG